VSKQILYCADGTWNGPGEAGKDDIDGATQDDADVRDNVTNVVKLFANLHGQVTAETQALHNEAEKALKDATGATTQVAKYMHGVGDSKNQVIRVLGGVFGAGVIGRVIRGYTFISRHYAPGDSIHIVGFSRGAYTARALAGMIGAVGLLNTATYDPNDKSEAYLRAFAAWMKCKGVVFTGDNKLSSLLNAAVAFAQNIVARTLKKKDLVTGVRIASVGVWDTVGSMGIPDYIQGNRRDLFTFVDTKLSSMVDHGFHAMALDERRRDFPVTRWDADKRIEEVWFVGAHSDVGGGYPAGDESLLSDVTLDWMTRKLAGLGVHFAVPPHDPPAAKPTASGFHKPWEKPPFNIKPTARKPGKRDLFHPSVKTFWGANAAYRELWPKGF
jgi:uncharacterized protein (DUF2235 family)